MYLPLRCYSRGSPKEDVPPGVVYGTVLLAEIAVQRLYLWGFSMSDDHGF